MFGRDPVLISMGQFSGTVILAGKFPHCYLPSDVWRSGWKGTSGHVAAYYPDQLYTDKLFPRKTARSSRDNSVVRVLFTSETGTIPAFNVPVAGCSEMRGLETENR